MGSKGCLPGWKPILEKNLVNRMVKLAENLMPLEYLLWQVDLDLEDWKEWRSRRCDWMTTEGRPPLERVIRKAWSRGVQSNLEEIKNGKVNWQNRGWLLERFDSRAFGNRFTKSETVTIEKPTETKKIRKIERSLEATKPEVIKQWRDVSGAIK